MGSLLDEMQFKQAERYTKAVVRNSTRFALSQMANVIIERRVEEVMAEFVRASQRGELLTFAPPQFTIGDLLRISGEVHQSLDSAGQGLALTEGE